MTGDANGVLKFYDRDGKLLGSSTPRKPNPKILTRLGQENALIRQRIYELFDQQSQAA